MILDNPHSRETPPKLLGRLLPEKIISNDLNRECFAASRLTNDKYWDLVQHTNDGGEEVLCKGIVHRDPTFHLYVRAKFGLVSLHNLAERKLAVNPFVR